MSCCGGKHIHMIQVNQEESNVDYVLKLNNPNNKEIIVLQHLIGGSLKIYNVGGQKYSAGGKYKLIEVFKEHSEELLKMKKFNRSIFRAVNIPEEEVAIITLDENLELESIKTESDEDTKKIVVNFDEILEAGGSLAICDTIIEIVEEPVEETQEILETPIIEEKVTKKRKRNTTNEE